MHSSRVASIACREYLTMATVDCDRGKSAETVAAALYYTVTETAETIEH